MSEAFQSACRSSGGGGKSCGGGAKGGHGGGEGGHVQIHITESARPKSTDEKSIFLMFNNQAGSQQSAVCFQTDTHAHTDTNFFISSGIHISRSRGLFAQCSSDLRFFA